MQNQQILPARVDAATLDRIDYVNPVPQGGKPPAAPPTNLWPLGLGGVQQGEVDPWKPHHEGAPIPTHEQQHAIATQMAAVAQLDAVVARFAAKLFPKPWTMKVGAGGIGQGTAGAATIQPLRSLLDVIHNPDATTPTTIALGELDGDPVPKFRATIAAGASIVFPTGLLFTKGITVLANSAGLPLTFGGRTLP